VVFPDAELKVWLTASQKERARRRLEQMGRGSEADEAEKMEQTIAERDERDASRSTSPMARPPDAVEIDSTNKRIDEVTDEILALAKAGSSRDR
jgi:cytidylate kinase